MGACTAPLTHTKQIWREHVEIITHTSRKGVDEPWIRCHILKLIIIYMLRFSVFLIDFVLPSLPA